MFNYNKATIDSGNSLILGNKYLSSKVYLIFLLGLIFSIEVNAQVYRCEGVDGKMAFQSKPCAGAASEKVEIHIPLNVELDSQHEPEQSNDFFEELRQERREREARAIQRSNEIRAERERQERYQRLIRENKVAIGMSPEQVRRSWGSPCNINRTISAHGNTEQWVYCYQHARSDYVYFRGGEVSSISN